METNYSYSVPSKGSMDRVQPSIMIYNSAFQKIIGARPEVSLCCENNDAPLFHEAGVFIEETSELFVTSNRYKNDIGEDIVTISKVNLDDEPCSYQIVHADIAMANGGVNYQNGVLFCDQGTLDRAGGLVYMSTLPPYTTKTLVSGFEGTPFNSLNDVVVARDGTIWFTDPFYGYEQGFRHPPQLPPHVYRFDPRTGGIRAMANGFQRPNGIAFSPDESTLYVTDTDHIHGDGSIDPTRDSTIYAFDVKTIAKQPFLLNRRLFAFAKGRAPDGIKCDTDGNVYSGCMDGISVWCPGGVLLGKILIPGGVSNFCFGRAGEILAMNEHRLWRITLANNTVGALLRIHSTRMASTPSASKI